MAPEGQSALRGRESECQAIAALLQRARTDSGQALVVEGPAGIGKTALLGYLRAAATDFTVLDLTGIESDVELAYAGLQQLCAPIVALRDRIPAPQRRALEHACGLADTAAAPDRYLVGLATLSLLAAASDDRPVLCVIDDAQWLDHATAQVLFFVARRLLAERVAIVFALRQRGDAAGGLPAMSVGPLNARAARALLDAAVPGRLDTAVADRIIAEARGNPLALLQIAKDLSVVDLAGGYHTPDAHRADEKIEGRFQRAVQQLPTDTQTALLVAAAEPVGDTALLVRALDYLGVATTSVTAAETAGLLTLGSRVRFAHPMVRSAVYRMADLDRRRAAHRALAAQTDPHHDPDRRAWHRGAAATGPDETIAATLERSARRAHHRGGAAASAAFLSRSVELTPDPSTRSLRALEAAETHRVLGAFDRADSLLSTAELGPLGAVELCRARLLRARLNLAEARRGDRRSDLIGIAEQFASIAGQLTALDPELSAQTYLEALSVAMYVGRYDTESVTTRIAADALDSMPNRPLHPAASLTRALAVRLTAGAQAAMPDMTAAVASVKNAVLDGDGDSPEWFWRAFPIVHESLLHECFDDDGWTDLAGHAVHTATQGAHLALLPTALISRAGAHVEAGNLEAARTCVAEATAISSAIAYTPTKYHQISIAAWSGDETETTTLVAAALREAELRGEGRLEGVAHCLSAILYNGLGRYQVALDHCLKATGYDDLGIYANMLVEMVEAGVRAGDHAAAQAALEQLESRVAGSNSERALGLQARSRALLATGDVARELYEESIGRLGATTFTIHAARSHLLYGEWLRRQRHHVRARDPLHHAFTELGRMGAKAFAERARRELLAAGDKSAKAAPAANSDLSAQELQIAQLASRGMTNQEIAAQMFVSPHTVEWHMRKVFAKMGIRSRRELRGKEWT